MVGLGRGAGAAAGGSTGLVESLAAAWAASGATLRVTATIPNMTNPPNRFIEQSSNG